MKDPKAVDAVQTKLVDALQLELRSNHPEQPRILAQLLMLIVDLRSLVEEHISTVKWRGGKDIGET